MFLSSLTTVLLILSYPFHLHIIDRATELILMPTLIIIQVIKEEQVSISCDIFSYGIVLWELLTHLKPFNGFGGFKVATMIVNGEVRLLHCITTLLHCCCTQSGANKLLRLIWKLMIIQEMNDKTLTTVTSTVVIPRYPYQLFSY